MKLKKQKPSVTAALSEKEIHLFTAIAHDFGVSRNVLASRLIGYFQDGRISWAEVIKQYNGISTTNEPHQGKKKYMRVKLEPEEYCAFTQRADIVGSTTGIILKKLVLVYITGKIERRDIW
jgi:hypothetical protein